MKKGGFTVEEYAHKNYKNLKKIFESAYEPGQVFRSGCITLNKESVGCYLISEQTIDSQYLYNLSVGDKNGSKFSWPVEATFTHMASSPSGQYVAFAYNPSGASNRAKISVYDTHSNGVCKIMDIDPSTHKQFWTEMNNFKFSPCSQKIMYSAQLGTKKELQFSDYEYNEYFGEDFDNLNTAQIYISSFTDGFTKGIEPCSDAHSYADPFWFPNSKGFMCTAYSTKPWRVFVQKCISCQAYVGFFKDGNTNTSNTIQCDWLCISDPETESSAWAGAVGEATENHFEAYYYSLPKSEIQHVLGTIPDFWCVKFDFDGKSWQMTYKKRVLERELREANKNGFHGVHAAYSLPFYTQNKFFTTTFSGATASTYNINTEKVNTTGRITFSNANQYLDNFSPLDSLDLMDCKQNYLLINHSSLISPPKAILAKWDGETSHDGYAYATILSVVSPSNGCEKSMLPKWNPFSCTYKDKKYGVFAGKHPYIQNIRKSTKPTPLVVDLHGGPFNTKSTRFSKDLFYLSELGFDIIAPNFPASCGFGLEYLQSIFGGTGRFEVEYIKDTVVEFVKENPDRYDMSELIVIGISYGGFLTCHLLGQYPWLFKVASCRNPVTNILHFYTSTDVPNWAFGIILDGKFPYDRYPNDEEILKLKKASPIHFIDNIRAPLLIAVGDSDIRVPNHGSIEFYHILKGQEKAVKLLYYTGRHLIRPPKCNTDYWINTALWFCYYCDWDPFSETN